MGNVVTLSRLERAVLLSEGEYCIAGDFNDGIEDLEPFAASIEGVILRAPKPTCRAGGGETFIDFFIVSEGLATRVMGYWMDEEDGMYPRRPWGILFGGKAIPSQKRELKLPAGLPLHRPIGCPRQPAVQWASVAGSFAAASNSEQLGGAWTRALRG